ncbi:MAG: TlyA family RNA methyltransferase [Clostridia bacterium]|nr:TlyA family RNA methyltransferase [Clostridia bacterium]
MRLDIYLVDYMDFESRSKAKYAIEKGSITVNGVVCTKTSTQVSGSDNVSVVKSLMPYVGRGGLKLDGAIKSFGLDVTGKTALDIGSSTGGFTDCLLQHGASKVLAVDIGHDQLHNNLREDSRVICMEGTDIRNLTHEQVLDALEKLPEIIVSDVSFISVLKIIQAVYTLSDNNTQIVLLLKPQFETEGIGLGKNGIVRDPKKHKSIATRVVSKLEESGIHICNIIPSPIKGGDGNIEYLLLCKKKVDFSENIVENYNIDAIIKEAFSS